MRAELVDLPKGPRTHLAESPRWDGQAWWWVDATVGDVWRRDPGQDAVRAFRAGQRVSLVHPEVFGRVVVACGKELFVLASNDDGAWSPAGRWCDLGTGEGWLVNDGVADSRGRLWIGTIAPERRRHCGTLLRVETDGRVFEAASGLTLTNGMAWHAEGARLLHADTFERRILAHHVDLDSGEVLCSETLISFDENDGMPDGIATDLDGGVWVAMYGSGQVRRYAADGVLDEVITVDAPQCTSVELGGSDACDVLITTAREGYDDERTVREPGAGRLYSTRSAYPGLPKPKVTVHTHVSL